jgi:hypothetical protein
LKEEQEAKQGDRALHAERSFTSYARSFQEQVSDTGSGAAI